MATGIYQRTIETERRRIQSRRNNGWFKNLTEVKEKMRQAKLGTVGNRKETKVSEETRAKLRQSHLGQKAWNKGMIGLSVGWPKGKKRPENTGENNYRWIVDRTKLAKRQERNDMAYKEWRMSVWKRDNFKCKISNQDCDGRIEAHHILGWAEYVELRYEVNNGITLCHAHHPRKRAEEKRLVPVFRELASVSK